MTTFVLMRDLTTPITRLRRSRRLAPAGLVLAAASLSMVAFVQTLRPSTYDATTLLRHHSDGELWQVVGTGVLVGGWAQWIWSVLVGLAIFALLSARVVRTSALGCLLATHLTPGVAVALAGPMLASHAGVLAYFDAAASCVILVVAGVMCSRPARRA